MRLLSSSSWPTNSCLNLRQRMLPFSLVKQLVRYIFGRSYCGGYMDKTNIIPMPVKANKATDQKFAQLSTGSDKTQSVIASGVIASTLALVLALNYQVSRNETLKLVSDRAPASMSESDSKIQLSTQNLAKKLSEKWGRQPASYGVTSGSANRIEQLQAGYFEGKYFVTAEKGKVWEVSFSASGSDRPKYISDKEEFLVRYKDVIGPDYYKPLLLEEKVVNGELIARYQLVGPTASAVAEVIFVSDESDRLISMKVQK